MRAWSASLPGLLLSAFIPVATVVLFISLTIFAGNATQFSSSYLEVLQKLTPYAALLVGALFVAGLVMTETGRQRYQALLNALAVLLWLQGNILVWNYGVLDGSTIDWLDSAWRGFLDASIWIIVLLAANFGFRKLGKVFFLAAIATFVIQVVASTTRIDDHPRILKPTSLAANLEGREAAMQFSSDTNIVHIVMDGFQSNIFAAIMADTSERDFRKELPGFTFFNQHLGTYPYTQLTMPAMLSGKLFYNDIPVEEFIEASIKGPTITNSAFDAGYELDIVAPAPLKDVYAMGQHNHAYGTTTSGHVTKDDVIAIDAAKLADLALFRAVPHFAKALVYRDELWVFQARAQRRAYLHLQYFSDLAFLEDLASEMNVGRDVPVYKLIHVMLSHRPIVGNSRCEFDGRKQETRAAVTVHAQCGLLRVFGVLQRMKELGIYDSSLIVMMADHGAWVPLEEFPEDGYVSAMTAAMALPMLAIKPPGAQHEYQVNPAPSSIPPCSRTSATA